MGLEQGDANAHSGAPYDCKLATVGNGTVIALVLDERAKIDETHGRALELCGTDEGVRGESGDQAFYDACCRDRDGNKFCAFRVGPARSI